MSQRAVISGAQSDARAFCLGKLPQYADFVSRGLEAPEADAWLEILTLGLAAAREETGESFNAAHDAAPAWRFVSGSCEPGSGWRAGAIAPSVDRAGRRFFFVAAVDGLDSRQAVAHGAFLTRNLDEAVYRAITEGLTIEATLAIAREALCCLDRDAEAALAMLASSSADGVWWTGGGPLHAPRIARAPQLTSDLVAGFIVPAAAPALQ